MFDIRAIRDNPDAFRAALERKQNGLGGVVSHMLDHDTAVRKAVADKQEAEAARNAKSKEIGKAKASGDDALFEQLRQEVAAAKDVIEAAGEQEDAARTELNKLLYGTPNVPMSDVPEGDDEAGNVEQHKWGDPNARQGGRNNVQDHADLGASLTNAIGQPMMDFEAAAAMSGARFVALRGQLARLERALASFMLDTQTLENGYEETNPPLLVREEALIGTGQLPKFGEDSFQTTDGHWLIATSEISLTNLVREQILPAENLPIRMTGHTPCFRSEAGSAGRDTKGMIRLHQFNKVEMVSIVQDEHEGLAELERMTKCAEGILEALDLPYRRMLLCAGDMGFGARKTYDLEVWLPSQNTYREISSCSYCGDFQARRMNARWRPAPSEDNPKPKPEFVHTLNGSGLAVGRTLVAVLENYQNEDGSITVPDVLRPYMGGLEVIS
ncbi:MAG: serine--tRNA ligase [Henriciella sp.]|nr:serine--tRNA ligase [Henriciella sp.]MBO6694691.1 serine--tRNA ligase [Henriciella sp.]